ncbi:MAG: hypothetical protein A2589_01355 [Candidatus Vogelbacteria bacterium RIFOXYD1_FULL_46_19]|uniref:Penicillin-binding protein transpeptidase domain-containing protein n=1 Tax=Candidatus Vogelbacteria bacterium RIFOXYD1_FULL_46_19 TaxID=1802439 RepID=A0A1G2QHN4_9BACT|nr:MAG: hypothetical protein A2589_01355 [Candidatus Vogelbacteria bacterium RIFOXYD1_FULL_46_19]
MKVNAIFRLKLIGLGLALVAVIFATRLFFLQVVHGDSYGEQADKQYLRSARTFFDRGSIYFSDKNQTLVPAATLRQEFLITMNPQLVTEADQVYDLLAPILPDLKRSDFLAQTKKTKSLYEEIAGGVTTDVAEKIKALDVRGLYVHKEKRRFYPAGRTAAHVLGFMANQNEKYTGIYGLEHYYNNILTSRETGSFASFFAEIFLGVKGVVTAEAVESEGDIVLTIEPVVQARLEKILGEAVERWGAEAGGAIIMDPHTGDILAMSAFPDFDPGGRQASLDNLPNPLVERVFEMGSVVKPLTLAAGLDQGVIKPGSTYFDTGEVILNNRRIMNHDKKARGLVDMQEVIDNSLNTGAVFVMQKMGKESFRDYMLAYGLGDKTGIDLPGEVAGLVKNLNSPREVEYATASFGQGIALTPIGITRAFAVLANGGKLVQPRVVKSIKYDLGPTKNLEPVILKEGLLNRGALEDITQMLIKAVDEALVGGTASLPNYSIAAKTGTAEIAAAGGGYDEDRYLHSFFGYYPAYQPRFVVFMYLVNPRNIRYSSETLTGPFMETAKFLLNYYEVPPDR